jgi:2-aminoethylphosphonate-pyruvate transaminase
MSRRTVLLNPGPVTLSAGVREALIRDDWCHREPEFAELTRSINRRLTDVYELDPEGYASVLLTCSGTGAVEAMLATFAPRNSTTLVVANGVYGERMARILAEYERPHEVIRAEWTAPIDLGQIAARLDDDGGISHVVAVHHETTTGRLNDIAGLGELCRQRGTSMLLDSVSAFGAEELRFDDWNVEAMAATANKCLHGVPGIAFVVAKRKSLAPAEQGAGSVYLDLRPYYETQHGDGYAPFTLAVQSAFALDVALEEFERSGGWRGRLARYREIAGRVGAHLEQAGVSAMLRPEERSAAMVSYWLPEAVDYQRFHDVLKEDGFVVYAGQGNLSGRVFRIAHMGEITDDDVDRLTRSLTRALTP